MIAQRVGSETAQRVRQAFTLSVVLLATTCFSALADGAERERIRIVGSSTVYPFAKAVADKFASRTHFPAPVVQSTGSGGGHRLFGTGVGLTTPDITASSRRMSIDEFERAQSNGVKNIAEAVIGYDGIAIAQHANSDPIELTAEDVTLAVAAKVPDPAGSGALVENPYRFWDEINDQLPHRAIKFYGPPSTSGTRDTFCDLCMGSASKRMPAYGGGKYMEIRQDGVWVDSGENDDLIVRRLTFDADAFGVFGYSFLSENQQQIRAAKVDGVAPNVETIASGEYPLSRSLFLYIKTDHLKAVPGLHKFVRLFMDENMIGDGGYLTDIGLVPLPTYLREASRQRVLAWSYLTSQGESLSSLDEFVAASQFAKK